MSLVMKMPSSYVSFSNQDLIVQRKRFMETMANESESSESSLESVGGSETPLIPTVRWVSYATPAEILKRMVLSLVPPLQPSRVLAKSHLDAAGSTIVVTLLISVLTYASSKTPPYKYHALEAVVIILLYMIISSSIVFSLGRLFTGGRYSISFIQIMILLGYSLIGHVLTLLTSFMFYSYKDPPTELARVSDVSGGTSGRVVPPVGSAMLPAGSSGRDYDVGGVSSGSYVLAPGGVGVDPMGVADSDQTESNGSGDSVFLFFLPFVAGSATLRVGLLLLSPIQSPHGRMILGNIFCLSHLLLLIFLHATYVHPTFQYGANG